jgi:regulator of sigma E protease
VLPEAIFTVVSTYIYPAVLVLFFFSLTLFAHEYGHFLVARSRGLKVERFSLFGLGPKIFGWTRNGVEYCFCWIPFGAYVSIPQMAEMDVLEGKTETKVEELPAAPPGTKILVALAGPVMNLVFAAGLACVLWGLGSPASSTVIGWVEPGSPEEQSGILPGDRIAQVNNQNVKTWGEFMEAVAFSQQPTVRVAVLRNGKPLSFDLETKLNEKFNVKTLDLYPREKPFVRGVLTGSPAEHAGLRNNDRFVAIEGVPLYSRDQLIHLISSRADQPTEIKLLRDGKMLTLTVVPEFNPNAKVARIGVELGEDLEIVRPGPTPGQQFAEVLGSMARLAKALVHHKETGVGLNSISGPIGITVMWWYGIVSGGILMGVKIAVLLNINFAVINLLPIPVLDGGHIIFSVVEAARRKALNARLLLVTHMTFAALLIAFMLYITLFSDLRRLLPERVGATVKTGDAVPAAPTNQP